MSVNMSAFEQIMEEALLVLFKLNKDDVYGCQHCKDEDIIDGTFTEIIDESDRLIGGITNG